MRFLSLLLVGFSLVQGDGAEPEIKGTAAELEQFLANAPGSATLVGDAEIRASADRAIVSLRVRTEHKSLSEAVRQNEEIRGRIVSQLKDQGVPGDRIHASKFSFSQVSGWVSDKVKGHRAESVMRITALSESDFRTITAMTDRYSEITFGGVEFEVADKEPLKTRALEAACDNVSAKRQMFETKFGLKLVPRRISDMSDLNPPIRGRPARLPEAAPQEVTRSFSGIPARSAEGVEELPGSFGDMIFKARVTVEYAVRTK